MYIQIDVKFKPLTFNCDVYEWVDGHEIMVHYLYLKYS